jgi:hypothetical protein
MRFLLLTLCRWVGDITYLSTSEEAIDLYSRKLMGKATDPSITDTLAQLAFARAT